jgi:two-component system sensor histidine kinase KdpD
MSASPDRRPVPGAGRAATAGVAGGSWREVMAKRGAAGFVGDRLRSIPLAGVGASVFAVLVTTGLIALLESVIPALSLTVLYIIAVLPIALVWGLGYGVAVSIASMLAFNFFFLQPLHSFALAEPRDWFALIVFVVTAVVVSELGTHTRRRAREGALLTEIATSLLEHGTVGDELERISGEAARALQVEQARIVLGPSPSGGIALSAGGRRVGSMWLEGDRGRDAGARRRLLPALASLLGVALDRERLAGEALEAEALRREDAIKTALLRSVSHDLRTPLMAITTAAGALARTDLAIDEGDRADLLATILAASDQLDRLVGDLLELSRLNAGAAQPEPELIEVEELVASTLAEFGEAGRLVEVSLPDELPPVRVDALQIKRALVNLVENAFKYSPPEEPIRIQVSAGTSEVAIRVIDHGPGVPLAERARIFEPFHRGVRVAGTPGAGLGLAIARGFVEANGGRLWVESLSGQGATFVVVLLAERPVGLPGTRARTR